LHLKTATIVGLAAEPEPFDLPNPPPVNDQAVADWKAAGEHVAQQATAMRQRRLATNGSPTLNRQTMEFLRDGAPVGDRHRLLFSAAANLAELDCPSALARALLTEPALDTGLSPKEVRRQIDCGLDSVRHVTTHQDAAGEPKSDLFDSTDG
jgi:hypothetical protein